MIEYLMMLILKMLNIRYLLYRGGWCTLSLWHFNFLMFNSPFFSLISLFIDYCCSHPNPTTQTLNFFFFPSREHTFAKTTSYFAKYYESENPSRSRRGSAHLPAAPPSHPRPPPPPRARPGTKHTTTHFTISRVRGAQQRAPTRPRRRVTTRAPARPS